MEMSHSPVVGPLEPHECIIRNLIKLIEADVPLELLKVRSGRRGTHNVGIAHEISSQTKANGPPLLFPTRF